MFSFFEKLTQPFPDTPPTQPPTGIVAFCKYYTKGMWGVILTVSVLSAIVAMLEVALFGFLGQLVDWFSDQNRDTFLADQKFTLIGMGLTVLVFIPLFILLRSLFSRQSLMGNCDADSAIGTRNRDQGSRFAGVHQRLFYLYGSANFQH